MIFDIETQKIIDDQAAKIKELEKIIDDKNKEMKHTVFVDGLFRHEISNHQLVVDSYINLLDGTQTEQERSDMIKKMSVSSQKIVDLMKEWSDYQKFGHQVQWQTLPQIFKECNGLNSNIKINIKRNNISIISTPVARIIMSSIVNNTAMHGGENANEVNVGWEKIPQGVAIICEDNGVGIPDLQKSVIFEKGFGRHRGMGLYLVKEILNMSGLKIAEKGTYGKGARFEIYVPDGAYKLY